MSERRKGIIFALAIVAVSIALFWKVWLRPGEIMSPGYLDIAELFAPREAYQAENTLATGELTQWDPYSDCGAPVVANIQNATFYPLYILFYVMPTDFAFGYIFWANAALGGLFCYLFLRELGRGRPAAFFGACVYMLAGVWTTKLMPGHIMIYNNFPWIPLTFFCARRAITLAQESGARAAFFALLGALAIAMQFFGGHTQFFLYSVFFLGLYCIFEIVRTYVAQGHSKLPARILLVILMFSVFVPIVAIQLLPSLEFASLVMPEGRLEASKAVQGIFSMDRWTLFIWPDYYGSPPEGNYTLGDYLWEMCPYFGIIPLLLTWAGMWMGRGKEKWFFLGMAAIVLMFAMGGTGSVYPVLGRLPGFAAFRVPARMISMILLPAVVISSAGAERLLEGGKRLRSTLISAAPAGLLFVAAVAAALSGGAGKVGSGGAAWVAVLSAAAALATLGCAGGALLRRILFAALLVLTVADLFAFSEPYIQTSPPSKIYPGTDPVLNYLESKADGIDFRAYEFNSGIYYQHFRRARMNMLTGDIDRSKLSYVLAYRDHMNFDNDLFKALNLRYVITSRKPDPEMKGLLYRDQVDNFFISEIDGSMPRAFVVRCVKSFKGMSENDVLSTMTGLRLTRCAVIEEEAEFALDETEAYQPAAVVKQKYLPNHITVEVEMDRPGFLVLSEIWYPAWKARDTVDGVTREKKVYKTDVILRGVFLEKGKHSVEFYFDSQPYHRGKTITLIALPAALALLAVLAVLGFKKKG